MTWGEYAAECATRILRCETQTEFDNLLTEIDSFLDKNPSPWKTKEGFWCQVRNEYYTQPKMLQDESIAGTALGNLIKAVQAMLEERAGAKK